MDASIRATLDAVKAIEDAGGALKVHCDGRPVGLGPRERVRRSSPRTDGRPGRHLYVRGAERPPGHPHRPHRGLSDSSADTIETIIGLLRARGTPPAFLHMDVDWHALGAGAFARDMPRLQAFARSQNITFGIIMWGYNGDADALFAADAASMANLIADAFKTWDAMPEHLIFQSWAVSSTGLLITPSNLPEDRAVHPYQSGLPALSPSARGDGRARGTRHPAQRRLMPCSWIRQRPVNDGR